MPARPISRSESLLAHWMGPADASPSGNIHGGTIMRLVDEVAGIAALRFCGHPVATVSIDRMDFLVPVRVGDLMTLRATLNGAWNTSMEIGVRADVERPDVGEVRHSNSAFLTFVALDDERRPTPIPRAIAETPEQERRMREAQERRDTRLALRAARVAGR